ncbi:hypothetical protein DFJ74DRAFT_32957 [Hyaloraphidium curvatum]|nr:hypothetical protein DFJ74DRAFT_32957 [Hyaloraphidium curvatum]
MEQSPLPHRRALPRVEVQTAQSALATMKDCTELSRAPFAGIPSALGREPFYCVRFGFYWLLPDVSCPGFDDGMSTERSAVCTLNPGLSPITRPESRSKHRTPVPLAAPEPRRAPPCSQAEPRSRILTRRFQALPGSYRRGRTGRRWPLFGTSFRDDYGPPETVQRFSRLTIRTTAADRQRATALRRRTWLSPYRGSLGPLDRPHPADPAQASPARKKLATAKHLAVSPLAKKAQRGCHSTTQPQARTRRPSNRLRWKKHCRASSAGLKSFPRCRANLCTTQHNLSLKSPDTWR